MAIPSSQLTTWSNPGALNAAKRTADSVKASIEAWNFPSGVTYEVYLQGSYRNGTNIRGDSDVDLVVELTSVYYHNADELPQAQRDAYKAAHSVASYTAAGFRNDLVAALEARFGKAGVDATGNKAITVRKRDGYLAADVVPCTTYRRYRSYSSANQSDHVIGIRLCTRDGSTVVNFPKQHYDNGCSKNQLSGQNYKPLVRVVKNARTYMVDAGVLKPDLAPSYFVECLLYNAPTLKFASDLGQSYLGVVDWLRANLAEDMLCQSELTKLFGTGKTEWSVDNARLLLAALWVLWEKWG